MHESTALSLLGFVPSQTARAPSRLRVAPPRRPRLRPRDGAGRRRVGFLGVRLVEVHACTDEPDRTRCGARRRGYEARSYVACSRAPLRTREDTSPMMTTAPAIASAAPNMSVPVGRWPTTTQSQAREPVVTLPQSPCMSWALQLVRWPSRSSGGESNRSSFSCLRNTDDARIAATTPDRIKLPADAQAPAGRLFDDR